MNAKDIKRLGDTLDEVRGYIIGDDNYASLIEIVIQDMKDMNISKNSAIRFTEQLLGEAPESIDKIYDEEETVFSYKIHEYFTFPYASIKADENYWKKVEQDIHEVLVNANKDRVKRRVYSTGSKNNIVVDMNQRKVYREIDNPNVNTGNTYEDIIGAVPSHVIIYDNKAMSTGKQYEIEWETNASKSIINMTPRPIDDIYVFLLAENLILDDRKGAITVRQLLYNMETQGHAEIEHVIVTKGMVYDETKKKIVSRKVNFEPKASKEKLADALYFLVDYVTSYFEGHEEKIITALKWGLIAPYSFVMKQMGKPPMEWMYIYGQAGSGKTIGYGYPMLYMYGKPDRSNNRGGSAVNNTSRLAGVLKEGTLPILLNEPGNLLVDDELRDMIKSSQETETSRGLYKQKKFYVQEPAYGILMITSNRSIPNAYEITRRFIVLNCSYSENTKETMDDFNEHINPTIPSKSAMNYFKVISGYVFNRIQENPDLLNDWRKGIDRIMIDLFKETRESVPDWLDKWVDDSSREDIDTDKIGKISEVLRASLVKEYMSVTRQTVEGVPKSHVLDKVISSETLPWITFKNTRSEDLRDHEVALSKGFADYLSSRYMEEQTIKDIAEMLGFSENWRRVLHCFNNTGFFMTRDEFLHFVFPDDDNLYPKSKKSKKISEKEGDK